MILNASASPGSVLVVTDQARDFILETRGGEADADRLGLFLEVSGHTGSTWNYDMWFQAVVDAAPSDVVVEAGGLGLVVLGSSIESIQGATLDLGPDGLVIVNPNVPPQERTPGAFTVPTSDLSSPLELAVLEILEHEVNPQIAAHGGRADLVAVEQGTAYLRLSGGCQGCGMAAVTLSQGISVAIKDALPEITEIVDVTAHAEGSDPYFAGAKK